MDEPTSNLDVRHQMYVSTFLKVLVRKTGMTVIMVSHDLNLSAKYADRMIVMEPPERIRDIGAPYEVVDSRMLRGCTTWRPTSSTTTGPPTQCCSPCCSTKWISDPSKRGSGPAMWAAPDL